MRAIRSGRRNRRVDGQCARRSVTTGLLLVLVLAMLVGALLHHPAAQPLLRMVTLAPLNLPNQTLIDQDRGRAIILTSPYGPDPQCRVLVLDTHTGALLGNTDVGPVPFSLALDHRAGRIFVSTGNTGQGQVAMVDERTGRFLGTVGVGYFPSAMAVDERTGRLFVVNATINSALTGGRGTVSVIDTRSGRVLQTVMVGTHPGEIVVDAQMGRVYVMNAGHNSVSVLDARSGRVLRTLVIGQDPTAVLIAQEANRVFAFGRTDARVFDAATGHLTRTVPLGVDPTATIDERAERVVVATLGGDTVSILDARTGDRVRTLHVRGGSTWPIVDEPSGRTFISNLDSARISVLETRSGHVAYTVPAPPYAGVLVGPTVGRFFVVNSNSVTIRAIADGRLVRTLLFSPKPIPPGVDEVVAHLSVALDERSGRALVTNYDTATVTTLDTRTGAVLHTTHVATAPVAALIDQRAGHALVMSLGGGAQQVPDPWRWMPSWLRRRVSFLPLPRHRTTPSMATLLDVTR